MSRFPAERMDFRPRGKGLAARLQSWRSAGSALWQRIDAWWFSWGSPLPLGLLRIGVGLCSFATTAMLIPFIPDWYLDGGFVPEAVADSFMNGILFSVLRGTQDPQAMAIFFLLVCLASLLMAVGFFSRTMTLLATLGTLSIQARDPFILQGADCVLRVTLIFLCFADVGAAVSFDRWWARRRLPEPEPYRAVALWPQKLILYQLAIIYFSTVFQKALSIPWRDGSAVYFALRLSGYQRFGLPALLMNPPFTNVATYGTLVVETLLGVTAFVPSFRKWVLPLGVALHGSILIAMNIPLFCELMLVLYVTFFTGEELEAFAFRWKDRAFWYWDRLRPLPASASTTQELPASNAKNL